MHCRNICANSFESHWLFHGKNHVYLLSLQTTVRIASYETFVVGSFEFGSPVIKSNVICCPCRSGVGNDCSLPYSLCLCALFLKHESHESTYSLTVFAIPGK